MVEINTRKLHRELVNAGLEIHGVSSDCEISWVKSPTSAQQETADAIINAHDPAPDSSDILHDEYKKADITTDDMIFALWKKIMQTDSTDADALQLLIDQIDLTFNR